MTISGYAAPPTHRFENAVGTVECWIARTGWVFTRIRGRFEMAHCDLLLAASDEAVRKMKSARFVHDWAGITSFEPAVAPRQIAWVVNNRKAFTSSNILVDSPLIAMAVRSANVTLGNVLTITSDRAAWEKAVQAHGA